jgi:exoribonuclease II
MSTEPEKEKARPDKIVETNLERFERQMHLLDLMIAILEHNQDKLMIIEKRAERRKRLQEMIDTDYSGCNLS